jgi:hypothetical protein
VLHSASLQQLDVVGSMKPFFAEHILPLLPPVDDMWQPSDFLPAPHQEDFFEQVRQPAGGWQPASLESQLGAWPQGLLPHTQSLGHWPY